jgi:hypothetical protein
MNSQSQLGVCEQQQATLEAIMSSSIWSQSAQSSSIFSHSESISSTNTEWTSEISVQPSHGGHRLDSKSQQKSKRQMGRPPNKWTSTRLRKLTRLYLLTDLELDDIINCLQAEDFQPWSALSVAYNSLLIKIRLWLIILQQAQLAGKT